MQSLPIRPSLPLRPSLRSVLLILAMFVAGGWCDFVGIVASPCVAQEKETPPTPTPLPKTGVLSRSSTFGYNTKMVSDVWGAGGDQGGTAPITGSVSKRSDREWVAKLFNNSEDTYSVSVEVVQLNEKGKRERSDSFSARLGAQESAERSLRATERTVDAELRLVSWKNLSERKRQSDATTKVPAGELAEEERDR